MSNSISFKSQTVAERSGDILVSFSSRWAVRLRGNFPKYVFRRRVPNSFAPIRVFIYLASPVSQIIGSFSVKKIQQLALADALNLAGDAQIDTEELIAYFHGYDKMGCYIVEKSVLFVRPISLLELREHFDFFPPQSFVALSAESSNWIDEKLGSVR